MATFGTAFIARPLGSLIFGHYADRLGRKVTLVGALLTMGIATFLIGLLPTFHQIGIFAPAMLTILRFFQGIGLGGEWSAAALLAAEPAKPGSCRGTVSVPQFIRRADPRRRPCHSNGVETPLSATARAVAPKEVSTALTCPVRMVPPSICSTSKVGESAGGSAMTLP